MPVEVGRPQVAPERRSGSGWTGAVLLVLAALLFLGYASRTIAAPFGDSHDGRNAGVWAAGSRALREDGPIASRLGTHSPENGVYANHPPLLYVETAVAEVLGPATTAVTRAPAWIGSLLVLVLLARLLREAGVHPTAVGMAVLVTATTPMFLTYGTMLDTPVTSLPFGLGVLLLWERSRRGDRVRPVTAAVLAALAVLAGWQSLLVAGAVGGWSLVRLARRSGRRELDVAFAGGALVGLGLLVGWLLWAFGGQLRPLLDQFVLRTGESSTAPVGLRALVATERRDALAMFGITGAVAAVGLAWAVRDAGLRGLAALALAVTVPYPFLFRSGAVNHDYWGYWFLFPLAVGAAAGAGRLVGYWSSAGRRPSFLVCSVATGCVVVGLSAWVVPPVAEARVLDGIPVGRLLVGAQLPADQTTAWYAGAVGTPAGWLALATRRPAALVPPSQYGALARSRPGDMVLVGEVLCVAGRDHRSYELRPAGSLADRPPGIAPCGSESTAQPKR